MLNPNDTFKVKLTRLYHPEPKIIYEGETTFHIQLRKNGAIGVLAVKPPAPNWAEYSEEDRQKDGAWVCEDYKMEILKKI